MESLDTAPGAGSKAVLAIESLLPADSPRLAGEDPRHVEMLAEAEGDLPPIVVQRSTMRVIDGMHRLRAAALRGNRTVEVRFFDGDDKAAFVRAVESNVAHGLPLSRADREAAATRIIAANPDWSDRVIAASTGLSGKTVGLIRRRVPGGVSGSEVRIGRDGRVRPLNSAPSRQAASDLITQRPDASLREVATAVGISPATVRDVRERMRRGEDPVPVGMRGEQRRREPATSPEHDPPAQQPAPNVDTAAPRTPFQVLQKDPSLRLTESGRHLLRWLDIHLIGKDDWADLVTTVPVHSTTVLATLARECAEVWTTFADELERHQHDLDQHDNATA